MALSIGTNPAALMAAHYTRTTQSGMQTAMERLASGSRINSASDDSAGVSIAAQLEAQSRGTEQAMRNAQSSKAAYTVADGALVEVENMLQRIRELSVQKASGTYSADDITAIDAEIDALDGEIGTIVSGTEFNGQTPFVGGTDFGPANKDGTAATMAITAITTAVTAVDATTLGTAGAAAVTAVDAAITEVSGARGEIGAFINQLDYRINNFSSIAASTEAAKAAISDTDYATESANLAKFQILQQASTAMLAQANASQQSVLALLQ